MEQGREKEMGQGREGEQEMEQGGEGAGQDISPGQEQWAAVRTPLARLQKAKCSCNALAGCWGSGWDEGAPRFPGALLRSPLPPLLPEVLPGASRVLALPCRGRLRGQEPYPQQSGDGVMSQGPYSDPHPPPHPPLHFNLLSVHSRSQSLDVCE